MENWFDKYPSHPNCRCSTLGNYGDRRTQKVINKFVNKVIEDSKGISYKMTPVENYIVYKRRFPVLLKGRTSGVFKLVSFHNHTTRIDDFQYTQMYLFDSWFRNRILLLN